MVPCIAELADGVKGFIGEFIIVVAGAGIIREFLKGEEAFLGRDHGVSCWGATQLQIGIFTVVGGRVSA